MPIITILIFSVLVCLVIQWSLPRDFISELYRVWSIVIPCFILGGVTYRLFKSKSRIKEWLQWDTFVPLYFVLLFFASLLLQNYLGRCHDSIIISSQLLAGSLFILGLIAWIDGDLPLKQITGIVILLILLESILGIAERMLWPTAIPWWISDRHYYFNNGIQFNQSIPRIKGTLMYPGEYGAFLCMGIPLIISSYKSSVKRGVRAVLLITLAVSVLAVFLSYTRAAYLCLILMAGGYCLYKIWEKPKVIKKYLILLTSLILVLVVFFPTVIERGLSSVNWHDYSLKTRGVMLQGSLEIIKDYPLTGVVVDSGDFNDIFQMYRRTYNVEITPHPHNIYLAIWLQWGGITLGLYLCMIASFINLARKSIKKNGWTHKSINQMGWVVSILAFCFLGIGDEYLGSILLNAMVWLGFAILWILHKDDIDAHI